MGARKVIGRPDRDLNPGRSRRSTRSSGERSSAVPPGHNRRSGANGLYTLWCVNTMIETIDRSSGGCPRRIKRVRPLPPLSKTTYTDLLFGGNLACSLQYQTPPTSTMPGFLQRLPWAVVAAHCEFDGWRSGIVMSGVAAGGVRMPETDGAESGSCVASRRIIIGAML